MEPIILPRSRHSISRKNIDPEALKVLYRLHKAGYLAYLVGGSVRDLLLNRTPKDFDVATDALPNRVRKLFRNAILIGRRFRLVHVKFKDQIIETSTFRKNPPANDNQNGDLLQSWENWFGTPEEDALRRDFTINGLFYNIADYTIIDYVGGLQDLKNRLVQTIGDPNIRFQEDPVRMIRAVRVAGRIGFDISAECLAAIAKYRNEILRCSPARDLEEIYHLLKFGAAAPSIKLFHETGLMEVMIPNLHELWQNPKDAALCYRYLEQLDRLYADYPTFTPPLLLSVLFIHLVMKQTEGFKSGEDLRKRVEECFHPFAKRFCLPRSHLDRLVQVCLAQRWFSWSSQRRFKPMAFVRRNFFPETLLLASLQMNAQDPDLWQSELEKWRSRIAKADLEPDHRKQLLQILNATRRHRVKGSE